MATELTSALTKGRILKETLPLLDFYRQRGMVADVSGMGAVDCVNRRVLDALGQPEAAHQ